MVPHATTPIDRRRSSSHINRESKFKFPDFLPNPNDAAIDDSEDTSRDPSPRPWIGSSDHNAARRESRARHWITWGTKGGQRNARHGRQRSLSEAIRVVRERKMSVSENAHEIAESLKAPVSMKLVLLCGFWYATSILTNTSSKAILTALPRPVTLTIIQFFLVSFWCIFLAWLAKRNSTIRDALPVLKNGIRKPSRDIIMATLPLTAFQIGGHILNADAMSMIPVSLVHTIKGLSPLMTVLAYRIFLDTKHSIPTYLSLIPLTLGVIMACSASFAGNFMGLTYAFGSAILFVVQNIVSKKIFTDAAKAEADGVPVGRRKPDKLNLLCYSSGLALLFTLPIWFWSEGWAIAADYFHDGSIDLRIRPGSLDHGALALEFIFNGTFHFGQSMVAFVLLGLVSPVTYSVASLIKRVVVIMFAIIWFGNPMTSVQGFGFGLTFLGLYLYDRTSDADKADRRARAKAQSQEPLLPMSYAEGHKNEGLTFAPPTPIQEENASGFSSPIGYMNGNVNASGPGRSRAGSNGAGANGTHTSLPFGTKAEETWTAADMARQQTASVR